MTFILPFYNFAFIAKLGNLFQKAQLSLATPSWGWAQESSCCMHDVQIKPAFWDGSFPETWLHQSVYPPKKA